MNYDHLIVHTLYFIVHTSYFNLKLPFPAMTIEQLKELKGQLAVLRRYL